MGPVSTGAVSWYFSHSPAIWKPVRGSRRQAILITSPCWARKAAVKKQAPCNKLMLQMLPSLKLAYGFTDLGTLWVVALAITVP